MPTNSVIRMVGDAEALRTRGYPMATLSSREDHSGGGGGEGLRGVEVAVDTDSANARGTKPQPFYSIKRFCDKYIPM